MWLGGYDITGALSAVALAASREEIPHARISDAMQTSRPGAQAVDAMVSGAYTVGAGEPPAIVAPRIFGPGADVSEWPLTVLPPLAPRAAGTDGNAAYNLRTAQVGAEWGGQHGEIIPFSIASRARTGRLERCTVVLPKATRTASATGTAYELGAVTALQKIVCVVHVFSVTGAGGSVTVRIESGTAGMAAPTTRATFAAVATSPGVGRQVLEVTTLTSDTWWRVVADWTGGTDYAAAAVAAMVAR